jgi:hypothetical protein
MPKERVRSSGNNSWGDLLVRWEKEGTPPTLGREGIHVSVGVYAPDLPGRGGFFTFTPEHPETFGMEPGSSAGPINIDLDRRQINRLITVLRHARDQAYGTDA